MLGRFHSVDPKPDEGDQESLSTYQYGLNNPILRNDPNGDCVKCWEAWEAIKNWFNKPLSALEQETGRAYMQSMTGRDITPTTQGGLILATIGYASQRMAGSVLGSNKIRIPRSENIAKGENFTKLSVPIRRSGPFGVDKEHHNANVRILNDEGKTIKADRVVSGNMTEEEKSLRFPLNTLASHTEARAVRNAENQDFMKTPGNQMVITGQQAPSPSCKGKMNKLSQNSGNTIIYQW